jgi:hypothetical protein
LCVDHRGAVARREKPCAACQCLEIVHDVEAIQPQAGTQFGNPHRPAQILRHQRVIADIARHRQCTPCYVLSLGGMLTEEILEDLDKPRPLRTGINLPSEHADRRLRVRPGAQQSDARMRTADVGGEHHRGIVGVVLHGRIRPGLRESWIGRHEFIHYVSLVNYICIYENSIMQMESTMQ